MLTAIIKSGAGPWELGRSLAPLVPGVIEGLLGEVLIVARPGDSDTGSVARASGAEIVESADWLSGFRQAVAGAKYPTLLVVDGGVVVGETFWAVAAHRLRMGDATRVLATKPEAMGAGTLAFFRLTGRVSPDQVLILPRALATAEPWSTRYRGKLTMLPATSVRLASAAPAGN